MPSTSTPASSSDAPTLSTVAYGTDAFSTLADQFPTLRTHTSGESPESPLRVALVGGTHDTRVEAMTALTRTGTGSVHSFRMPMLLGELRMQTQNGLRKAFDHASEEGAVLFFDDVEALHAHEHTDALDGEGASEPTAVEYFFDRVEAYRGIVILGVTSANALDPIRPVDVRVTL